MAAGRKPQPLAVLELKGTKRKDRHGHLTKARQAPGDLTDPPPWFNAAQREAWRYSIAHAVPGVLNRIDRSVLTDFVVSESIHRMASKRVQREGLMVWSGKGERRKRIVNPLINVINQQAQVMLRAAAELGFTPTSRPRLRGADDIPTAGTNASAAGAPVTSSNPFDEFTHPIPDDTPAAKH